MTCVAGNILVIGRVFFVLVTRLTGLLTRTLMNLTVHLFNSAPITMAAFTGFHLVIVIEFCPILCIRMAENTIPRIMWVHGCFYFIRSQSNKIEGPHRDCFFLCWIIIKMAGNTIINTTMVIRYRLPGDRIMTIRTFSDEVERVHPVTAFDLEIIPFR